VTPQRGQADEWALALTSAGIAHVVQPYLGQWALGVAAGDVARAQATIDAYARENRRPPSRLPAVTEYGTTYAGIALAVGLVGFYAFLVGTGREPTWFRVGDAAAVRILDGEIWRAVTALTLHVNLAHVVGNAVCCAIFVTALCHALGPGVAMWIILLAGASGNVMNAALHGAPHTAVGASTAIFGAVGALGALQVVTRSRLQVARWRAWLPIAAALGLLAMLGTSADSDVLAHLFGFLAGLALGAGSALMVSPLPGRVVQGLLTAAALLTVIAAWMMGLAHA
jgi:membrane associated rhomboid family serine protease